MLPTFDIAAELDAGSDLAERLSLSKAETLLNRVRRTFPSLVVHDSRLEQSGGDHLMLIVDDDYAFRFPRRETQDLGFEIEVLRRLRHRSPVAVPAYDYVDPMHRFAGYRFIDGQPLTRDTFARLGRSAQDDVLGCAVDFLRVLHDLPQADATWSGSWPTTWSAAQFADRGLSQRLPLLARHVPQLAAPVAAFFEAYRLDRAGRLAIVHGDLVGEHMLIDRAGSTLVGIIDFGDVALGDPAQDLLGFWSYGAEAIARVIGRYDPRGDDPDLLRRSHNHFVRYRLDQLFERLRSTPAADTSADVAEIQALLAASPTNHPTDHRRR